MGKGTKQAKRQQPPQQFPEQPPAVPPSGSAAWAWLAALGAAAASLVVYYRTMAPSLVEGDNPELIVAAHVLGVPHPTGYPLLLVAAKALELALPVGSVAFRLNLVAGIFGAAAAGAVAWLAARVSGRAWCGLAAGVLAGLGRGLWSQSVAFEVYSLHALLVALVLVALVRWEREGSRRSAYLVALAVGFSLAHHRTAVFWGLPAWLVALLGTKPRDLRFGLKMAALAAAPCSLYLLLVLLALRQPALNWGAVHLGWRLWLYHISGLQYKVYILKRPLSAALAFGGSHWQGLLAQYTVAGPVLALMGALTLPRRALWMGAACSFLLCLFWAYLYSPSDALVLAIPAEMLLAFWMGLGLGKLVAWADRIALARLRWLPVAIPAVAALALVTNLLLANWKENDQSQQWWVYRQMRLMMDSLPPGPTLLLTDSDTAYGGALYLQVAEGSRPDVMVIPISMLRSSAQVRNIPDRALARAITRALWEDAARRGSEEQFLQKMVQAIIPAKGHRRLITSISRLAFAPGYAWKDDGLLQEPLPAWPNLEARVPGARPSPGQRLGSLGVMVEPHRVQPGQLFTMQFRWLVGQPIDQRLEVESVFMELNPPPGQDAFKFGRVFPLCFGRTPLPPSRPGWAYVQTETCLAPMHARPGKYLLVASVRPLRQDEQWVWPLAVELVR